MCTAILSCELSGDGFCSKPPTPGKPTVESASTEQCSLRVAGTLGFWGLYNPAAGHEAGGIGQGLSPSGLP